MKTIKLYHPILNVSVEQIITPHLTENKIKLQWKKRYGKVFDKCVISITNTDTIRHRNDLKPPIIHISTGEVFDNMFEASEALGVSITLIYNHCHRLLKKDSNHYAFKFKTIDLPLTN